MLGTRRHDHKVSSFDILVFSGYGSFPRSGCERQSLVDGVDLSLVSSFPMIGIAGRAAVSVAIE